MDAVPVAGVPGVHRAQRSVLALPVRAGGALQSRTSSPRTAILSAWTDISIRVMRGRQNGWFRDTISKSALMITSRNRGI